MGIETTTYRLLQQIEPKDKTCLCLGYSDLLVDPALIEGEYTELEDADKIRSWHNWPHPVYDTTEVLTGELGFHYRLAGPCSDVRLRRRRRAISRIHRSRGRFVRGKNTHSPWKQ